MKNVLRGRQGKGKGNVMSKKETAVEAVSRMKLTMNSSRSEDGSQGWPALDAGEDASSLSRHENMHFSSGVVLL